MIRFPFFPGTNLQDLNLDWLIQKMKALETAFMQWPHSPRIEDGEWYVYDETLEDYVSTGVPATGPSPMIGNNGNWFVWDANTLAYVDTGVHAQGPAGEVTQAEFDALEGRVDDLEDDTSELKSALHSNGIL